LYCISLPFYNKYMINICSILVLYHCLTLSRTYLVLTIFPVGRLYYSETLFNFLAAPLSETETALMEH